MTHDNNIIDKDPFFEIDDVTRKIVNPASSDIAIVQFDHNSERFTFRLNKDVEGHDMTKCNRIEVHYKNTDAITTAETLGVYEITDLHVDPEDETKVLCTWLISQNATQKVGKLDFLLRFSCVEEDGTIKYAWNTSIFTGIMVSAGLLNSDDIAELYPDVLEQWKTELFDASAEGVENIYTARNTALTEVETARDTACAVVESKGQSVADSLPDDYIKLSEKVKNVANALKGAASGEAVGITDVSPLEHTMGVKVRSKNIAYDATYADLEVGETNKAVLGCKSLTLEKGKTYTMSFDTENTGGLLTLVTYQRPLTVIGSSNATADGTRKSFTFTMKEEFYKNYNVTWVQLRSASTANSGLCSNFQIEEGYKATPYTPYISDLSGVSLKKCGKNILQMTDKIASGDAAYQGVTAVQNLIPNVTYTLSADYIQQGVMSTVGISVRNSSGATIARSDDFTNKAGRVKVTFTVPENGSVTFVFFSNITANAVAGTVCTYSKMCLAVGETNEEFEEYVAPSEYVPDENGDVSGVTAIYPSTTLLSDSIGVIIDCQYNRDINKAYEELTNAIISLGGNV